MRIINLTPVRRARLIKMLEELIPEYSAVRIDRNGLVVRFKRKRFNPFEKAYAVSVDSMCLLEIPKRLEAVAKLKNLGTYTAFFQNTINAIVYFKNHQEHSDVVDYLWEMYLRISGLDFTVVSSGNKKMIIEKKSYSLPTSRNKEVSDAFKKVIDNVMLKKKCYSNKITKREAINRSLAQIELFFINNLNIRRRVLVLR